MKASGFSVFVLLGSALSSSLAAAPVKQPVAVAAATEAPLFAVDADRLTGKIIATLPAPDADGILGRYLYLTQIDGALGSAPIGIDRAMASEGRVLIFRRVGKKVAAEIENSKFIASAGTADEREGVRHAFAGSTLWLGDVLATKPDGAVTVDLSSFLARDDMDLASAIKRGGGGDYKFVPDLSVADPNFVKAFPRNVELEARLTFRADEPREEVANITGGSSTLTIVVRHSLIALPGPGFVPRRDAFGYSISLQQVDYSAPLGTAMVHDLATHFRLEKVDPAAARSAVKRPIVFYIDPAAPEPVRAALIEGVNWWHEAFDAAGLVDAFRAEVLPEGVDPLDVRYNVVNWVNRATRGWSYGQPISDPRTGEIIKGSVLLGSLRVRQDLIIYQALVGAGLTGTGDPDDPVTAALARIRQLGAHEVGHALGFAHNFAASTQGRYSVMDYPAPRVTVNGDKLSLQDAYGVGLGPWDRFLVQWLYGAKTDAEAVPVVADARRRGLRFVADDDSRPLIAAQPIGALWDDGPSSITELARVMEVRRVALARFGVDAIPADESLSQLRRAFVPIWLIHRYQVEAVAKSLGGVDYDYGLARDQRPAQAVSGAIQQAALDALLGTLAPDVVTVPARLQPWLSSGFGGNPDRQTSIELIPTGGGPVFDPLRATETAAAQTLAALLAPERLNRLEAQHSADSAVPSPAEVIDRLLAATIGAASQGEVARRTATTAVLALAQVQRNQRLSPTISLEISARLDRLADQLAHGRDDWSQGLAKLLRDRGALDKAVTDPARLPVIPPGMPIGMDAD
jgi:hypothetical protein